MMIVIFALVKLVLHLATSSGYGYFRDELYYLACAEHPAMGYVDHPPLSVFVMWAVRHVLGDSLLAIRFVPALLGAATVALVGMMTRAMGGQRWAQALAMTAALVAPQYMALDHFYSMNAFDVLFWALTAYVVIRLIDSDVSRTAAAATYAGVRTSSGGAPRTDSNSNSDSNSALRWWVILGVVLGLGLLNKISMLWVGAGLFIGIVATPHRRWLLTPGPWIAGVIAAVLFAPHVIWQMQNGWPTAEFIRNATTQKMVHVAPLDFVHGQIDMMNPFTLPLWLAGLVYLFANPAGKKYRLLGWIYVTAFAILVVNGASRAGYLAPAYTWLFAAGGIAVARLLDRPRVPWLRWLQPAALVILLAGGVIVAPLVLPILPIDRYISYARAMGQAPSTEEHHEMGELGQFFADMHGWDAIAATAISVYNQLPASDRAQARIFAPDYGVAGAIDLFGRRQGLPPALSGHNNYWLWGPRDWNGRVVIVIGGTEAVLRSQFEQVKQAATIECGRCMPYENHRPVWIARNLRGSVADLWPHTKHFE